MEKKAFAQRILGLNAPFFIMFLKTLKCLLLYFILYCFCNYVLKGLYLYCFQLCTKHLGKAFCWSFCLNTSDLVSVLGTRQCRIALLKIQDFSFWSGYRFLDQYLILFSRCKWGADIATCLLSCDMTEILLKQLKTLLQSINQSRFLFLLCWNRFFL